MGAMAETIAANVELVTSADAFDEWMRREQKRIFLLCRRMLQDTDEADSATQDVFLKAYRALQSNGSRPDDPGKWLTRIAVNACLDKLRSRRWQFWRKRPNPSDEETILLMTTERSPSAEDRVFASEIGQRLERAIEALSGRQKAVFVLRHFEYRSLEEIAEILGLDVGTVKAHMSRALGKLREDLKDLYAGTGRSPASRRGD